MIFRFVTTQIPSSSRFTSARRQLRRFSILLQSVGFALFAISDVRAASLTLEWDPPSDEITTGYIVSYGNAPGNYTAEADVGLHIRYRVEGLADGTQYCFAVQAYDGSGNRSARSSDVCVLTGSSGVAGEIVMHAARTANVSGTWARNGSSEAAGGRSIRSVDSGWSSPDSPLASPANYFDLRFQAQASTPYRVWLRLRALADSKWNDSVWVQFSDALVGGKPAYRMGSTSALLVNLERCGGCGVAGWGWFNSAYWLAQATAVTFAESGTKTMRIQTREDGVEIDQVVLSPVRYMTTPPGASTNDTTILRMTGGIAPVTGRTPHSGTPIALPGRIDAAHFDNGGTGMAYAYGSPGNSGGAVRTTDVDVQPSPVGGYNIGWTRAGDWVSYPVNVTKAGTYTATFRVASVGRGSLEVAAGAPSTLSRILTVPNTGGWQTWTTLRCP